MHEVISEELQVKMRMWLSYWALWPFFHVSYSLANSLDRIGEEDRPAIDGLFVALILWTQFWEASRVAPYGFALCAVCLQGLSQRASRVADVAGSRAVGHATSLYEQGGAMAERLGTSSPTVYIAAALAVIVVVSVLLQIVELTEALVTLVLLFCVAFDSARCVARSSTEVYTSRLAFWIIAMAWLKFRELPVLGATLTVWTPLVLIAALAAGETILSSVVYFVGSLRARLFSSPQSTLPPAGMPDAMYQEVSSKENAEDGRALNRTPLSQSVEDGGGL